VIVLDASAALSGLLNAGPARESLAGEQLHAPHLIDSEIASGLGRQVRSGRITADDGWAALDAWRRMGLTRYATRGLLERIWELRDNLSAYDAGYVALAESLECSLVTADARISRSPGIRCPVTVVPR
jgi:predicted nucleic acid-binding protein